MKVLFRNGNGAERGWLGSIIGIVGVFGSDIFANGDLPILGAAMAVCSLTVLYGYFIKNRRNDFRLICYKWLKA